MYFSLTVILGAISVFCINTSLLPKTNDRRLLASARYEGARASEIKKLVAIPLEESLSSLKDAKRMESVSRDGLCAIKIELKWGADAQAALLEANALLDAAAENIPEDCSRPRAKIMANSAGAARLCVIPKDNDMAAATDFARNELKAKILSFDEAACVEIFGGQKPEIQVIVDFQKAAFYGLSLDAIAQSLNLSNYDYPAGTIQDGNDEIILKTEGTYKNFSDILATTLKTNAGPLKLGDIARTQKSVQKSEAQAFYNGQRCAQIAISCKKNKNPLALAKKIKALANESNAKQSKFVVVVADDSAGEIRAALKNLFLSALAGVAAAFALLIFFFNSVKIAALTAAVIPLGALFSFTALLVFGKSANIVSIMGISVCLGMTLDNSIVAMQSLLGQAKNFKTRKASPTEIAEAVSKISLENSASTATTMIVFVPIFFIGGIIGELFCDLGIAVISGMAFSLLFSFTALPAICAVFLADELKAPSFARTSRTLDFLDSAYRKILSKTNRVRFLCPAVCLASCLLSALIFVPMKKELSPKGKQKTFWTEIYFEPGTSKRILEQTAQSVSKEFLQIEGVQSALASFGLEKDKLENLADARARAESVTLETRTKNAKKAKALCQKILQEKGLDFLFFDKEDLLSERLCVKSQGLFVGESEEELFDECQKRFGQGFYPSEMKARQSFKANKGVMEKVGVTPLALSAALKSSFDGTAAFPYYENGKEISLKVKFEENEFSSQKNLAALRVPARAGMIPLSALGRWQEERSECVLYRCGGKDAKILSQSAGKALEKKRGGNFVSLRKQETAELLKSGALLLLITLILLYCVLGAQTESFLTPLIYLSAIPPAFLGAALFLFAFASSLNLNSIIALASLFGTSVNSAIILREGGSGKFFSVLATSSTSVAALLPFAFDPFGANPQSSLALAICGGLVISTAASLVMIPNITGEKNESV